MAARLSPPMLHIHRRMRVERTTIPYPWTQLSALGTLARVGALSVGDLASAENVQPPSMTKIVVALTDAGLVRRDVHPADRRQSIITITPRGIEVVESTLRASDEWLAVRLAKLTDAELDQLEQVAGILAKIAGH
jgi:DNA-binding MarR family transcriptional regulator